MIALLVQKYKLAVKSKNAVSNEFMKEPNCREHSISFLANCIFSLLYYILALS